MHEIFVHKQDNKLWPVSMVDEEKIRDFPDNKPLRAEVYGVKRPRSLAQLNMYWATCEAVAQNIDDKNWNTKEKVDFQCRVATNFVDLNETIVDPHGNVHFKYRSIAFKNLSHIEACDYFNKAWDIMAAKLGVTVDKLLENTDAI
jgi:hypothetical protein